MSGLERKTLFVQLADIIRREIDRDGYPGNKISSERELAARFKVSPVTVREALGILREERLIERRHGSGSYVLERKWERIGVVLDFDIADQGLSYFYRSSTQSARRRLIIQLLQGSTLDEPVTVLAHRVVTRMPDAAGDGARNASVTSIDQQAT